jgi:hypothetical protein
MVLEHPYDVEVFHYDDAKLIYQTATEFVREVFSAIRNPFVDMCDYFASFRIFRRFLFCFGQAALCFCQCLRVLPKEAEIGNLFPCRKGGKARCVSGNGSGSTATLKDANHLSVLVRRIVRVLIVPAIGR